MSGSSSGRTAVCSASPNLALVKYWGKQDTTRNLPATPSLGITLEGLRTRTRVSLAESPGGSDRVVVDGRTQPEGRYAAFFQAAREFLDIDARFLAESTNSFAAGAGLASSASGFAALALACTRAAGKHLDPARLSALARVGSASAARSLFSGFVLLPAGATAAVQRFDASHWPELRLLVVTVRRSPKAVSSRDAMERARETSPFYSAWVASSGTVLEEAVGALEARDLQRLGEAMRSSYLGMFSTMFTSRPPVLYWVPDSLRILHLCEALRKEGIGAWETMDAGPQVKILCTERDVEPTLKRVREEESEAGSCGTGEWNILVTRPGGAPVCEEEPR